MDNDKNSSTPEACDVKERKKMKKSDVSSVIYGMGFIGAIIYFIQHATSFWMGVLGVFKAVFWPVIMVYKLLELLKM